MTASMRIFLWIGASLLALLLTCLGLETLRANLTGWFLVITGGAYLLSILGGVMARRQAGAFHPTLSNPFSPPWR